MKIVLIIFTVTMVAVYALKRDGSVHEFKQQSKECLSFIRQARASVVLLSRHIARRDGRNAVEKMLRGARETTASANSKYFQKRGNFATAVREFKSLKPDDVLEHEENSITGTFVIDGTVGDRMVEVKQRGHWGWPSIEIKQMGVKPNNPFYMNYIISYVD